MKRTTDYNFNLTPHDVLASAGFAISAPALQGTQEVLLQLAAEGHSKHMAYLGVQGHQGWEQRYKALIASTGYRELKEICAESWPGQNELDAAGEMYNSWRQSPGHWSAVQTPFRFWGIAMTYNEKKEIWYACGIFGS